jgi:outer membrane protein assembly factor BamB
VSVMHRWIVACGIGVLIAPAKADWPQYRGPNGDGVSAERMLASWPTDGPKVLWKIKIGDGLGSFAIKDGRAYTLGAYGDNEACVAVDMKTGQQIWSTPLGITQDRNAGQGGGGPGSTPTVDGDRVYVYGSLLKLTCMNAADGKIIWQHDIQEKFAGQGDNVMGIRSWGSTASPVIDGEKVIIHGGGRGQCYLAFNKTSGDLIWKSGSDTFTHATPTLATIGDVRQAIFFCQNAVVGIDVSDGKELWRHRAGSAPALACSPIVSGDIVYTSAGYNIGALVLQVSKEGDKFTAKQLWTARNHSTNQWSTPVVKDGYLYGIHGGGNRGATIQCVELATGKLQWNGPAVGQGEVLLVDNKLLVQCADGRLLLVEPDPKAFKEISKAQPLRGQAWGWPAFSDGIFVYRTNVEAAAVDLSAK